MKLNKAFVLAAFATTFSMNQIASASCYSLAESNLSSAEYSSSKGLNNNGPGAIIGTTFGALAGIATAPATGPVLATALTTTAGTAVGAAPGGISMGLAASKKADAEEFILLMNDAKAGDGLKMREFMEDFKIDAPAAVVANQAVDLDSGNRFCQLGELESRENIGQLLKLVSEKK